MSRRPGPCHIEHTRYGARPVAEPACKLSPWPSPQTETEMFFEIVRGLNELSDRELVKGVVRKSI